MGVLRGALVRGAGIAGASLGAAGRGPPSHPAALAVPRAERVLHARAALLRPRTSISAVELR